jgi:ribonuclease-3
VFLLTGETEDMTELQNTRGTNLHLAQVGFAKGINEFILLNPSLRGVVQERLMATTMEAILGAVYLDARKDIQAVLQVAVHLGLIDDA